MNHQKKTNLWKTRHKILLGLLMGALVLSSIGWMGSLRAQAVDWEKDVSLTVDLPDDIKKVTTIADSNVADLDIGKLVIDLYKIADAKPVEGYDTYDYEYVKAFADEKSIDFTAKTVSGDIDWVTIQGQIGNFLLQESTNIAPEEFEKPLTIGETIALGKNPGLYLVVIRGLDAEGNLMTDKGDYVTPNDEGLLVTQAYGSDNIYTFAPQLISIPERKLDGTNNTANQTDWQYEPTMTLKVGMEPRLGNLEIVKTLIGDNFSPATVVFSVTYKDAEGQPQEQIRAISFNTPEEARTKSILIENIPIQKVTVTEFYPGGGYTIVSPRGGIAEVNLKADDVVSVTFENTLTHERPGTGIVNNFTYTEGAWNHQGFDTK